MKPALGLKWSDAYCTPLFDHAIGLLPIEDRIVARIAFDQLINRPWLGKHFISPKKLPLANDNRKKVFYGRTIVGIYSFAWVADTVISRPVIIDVSTQMFAAIKFVSHMIDHATLELMPVVVEPID